MYSCKSVINLKVFKKPSGKSLRVWAKKQSGLKIFEKNLKLHITSMKISLFAF